MVVGELEPTGRVALPARLKWAVDEPLGAVGAEIGLGGRARHGPVDLRAGGPAEPVAARLGEQGADRLLGLLVLALAEVHVAHVPVRVDQVLRRPVAVRVRVPGAEVVVLHDRVAQALLIDRVLHVPGVLLERELGGVHADDRESLRAVPVVPSLELRQRADAVDARVGPEVDQHHTPLPAEVVERDAAAIRGVEPALGALERGCGEEPLEVLRALERQPRPAAPAGVVERIRHRGAALEPAGGVHEEAGQVRCDGVLEADVEVREHQRRDHHHHHAESLLEAAAAAREAPHYAAAAQHQRVERDGGAEAVGEGGREPACSERLRRRQRDDPGEDGPRAGRVDEAERDPDEQPGREPALGIA
jgi:hypothetical protein